MKVLHICHSDSQDGGAIGARRLHAAMRAQGIDSRMLVIRKRGNDDTVIRPSLWTRFLIRIWNVISLRLLRLQRTSDYNYRSLNVFPTGIHRLINHLDADVVQCHWINKNMISIGELPRIQAPLVLKLPDMWAFSGTEHYILPGAIKRYKEGYARNNRQPGDHGLDLDRHLWNYKKRAWRHAHFTIVAPSKWLGECAKESMLFGHFRVENIANPIDLNVFRPAQNKRGLRSEMGLPTNKHLILFGSQLADTDPRKGYRHLRQALSILQTGDQDIGSLEILMFGTREKGMENLYGIPAHRLGTICNERDLVAMYAAADVMVLPTEADNLPNTIQEATACGTPCVGFNIGGMPDMIVHRQTGYLAEPFDSADLARGIAWVLANKGGSLSGRVRQHASRIFDPASRVNDYMNLYRELTEARRGPRSRR